MAPLPHIAKQILGAPEQVNSVSTVQFEQPSPTMKLLSSHTSPASITPSPHLVHFLEIGSARNPAVQALANTQEVVYK